jgi:hypothetical protein
MQKISRYLYPNRIELLADLAGFTVEFTNVYQRTIKIYNGIDNTIEFDIKNADQKRIDLTIFSDIQMNVMDVSGNALPNSPYTVAPTDLKGISTVTIPSTDLAGLSEQSLVYSVTATKDNQDVVMLYADARFSAVGYLQLANNAMPKTKPSRVFDTFTAEIDLNGVPIYHSSAIPCKSYEAIPSATMSFEIHVTGFVGSIWIDATKNDTINVEAFKAAGKPFGSWTQTPQDGKYTGIIPFAASVPINDYSYFRVSYQSLSVNGIGASFDVVKSGGQYSVTIRNAGTGYTTGAIIRVPGTQLGGVDTVNDLFITVTGVNGNSSTAPSSYTISSIAAISIDGVASTGTHTYVVSGINYSGMVDKIIVL